MADITTYPEMNKKIVSLLRLSDDPMQLYAAQLIEELRQEVGHYEQTAKDYWEEACDYKASVPKWIPVSEQLPPIDEEVLVFAYGNEIRVWVLEKQYPYSADVYWECEEGYWEEVSVVTHWMPLPEPPEDGET